MRRTIEELLKGELKEIKEKYARKRRTQIIEDSGEITDRDLITEKEVVLFLTHKGLVKRIPLEEYRLQKRGGKGLKGWELKVEGDFVWKLWGVNTLDRLLVFSSLGRLHWLDVYKVPSGLRQTKARSLNNLLSFKEFEEPRLVLPLKNLKTEKPFIVTITRKGIIKKSLLSLFSKPRAGGVNAVSIDKGDMLQDVQIAEENIDFLIYTRKGQVVRIKNSAIRSTGKLARGVRAVRLKAGDFVVSMEAIGPKEENQILVITEKAYGKRVKASEFTKPKTEEAQVFLVRKLQTKPVNLFVQNWCLLNSRFLLQPTKGSLSASLCLMFLFLEETLKAFGL